MEIKNDVNPVGKAIKDEHINMFIETMKTVWDKNKTNDNWWKVWKKINPTKITVFLINCVDDLVNYLNHNTDIAGSDKKATVLWAVGSIYDYIAKEAMPIRLVPFSGYIRNYLINVLVSYFIDWTVEKYRNGSWRKISQNQVQAQWVELNSSLK